MENGWVANDTKAKHKAIKYLPIPRTAIYVPFSPNHSGMLMMPFKSKCLHPLQLGLFFNASYSLFSKRKVAIAKNINTEFSKKTHLTREREVRKFINAGGEFRSVSNLEGNEISSR